MNDLHGNLLSLKLQPTINIITKIGKQVNEYTRTFKLCTYKSFSQPYYDYNMYIPRGQSDFPGVKIFLSD